MTDYAPRRTMMVDTQVRPNDVTKYPIIDAMLTIAREEFVPEPQREAAYAGENLDLAPGRVVLEPRTFAKMLDALDVQPQDRVLILGAGFGYSAAVVARLAGQVVAVEEDASLAAAAEERLRPVAGVTVQTGALRDGAPSAGPFDRILIEGGIEEMPEAVLSQLNDGGRIAALFMDEALGAVRIGYRIDGQVSWRFGFNAAAPVLAGFARRREFTF
ncbi:MAG: protein-L-isoaspartate O-methyltransferase [Proteobacteria bacterium]|nr:protein-L-isoaspartate O-methyltransferase [Pseudomonadota bacterium]MBS0573581.1 protein-L-isoaspartate O-methyltransferase [Pseudomonadota bacterium]